MTSEGLNRFALLRPLHCQDLKDRSLRQQGRGDLSDRSLCKPAVAVAAHPARERSVERGSRVGR